MSVTLIGNKLQVEVLADESTKTQLNDMKQEVKDLEERLEERVDTIIAGTVGGVSGAEIVDARQGEVTLGANITKVKSQLAQKVGLGKKAELEDLSPTVLSAIEGGEDTSFNLLSVPQDGSVTLTKLDNDVRKAIGVKPESISWEIGTTSNGEIQEGNPRGLSSVTLIDISSEGLDFYIKEGQGLRFWLAYFHADSETYQNSYSPYYTSSTRIEPFPNTKVRIEFSFSDARALSDDREVLDFISVYRSEMDDKVRGLIDNQEAIAYPLYIHNGWDTIEYGGYDSGYRIYVKWDVINIRNFRGGGKQSYFSELEEKYPDKIKTSPSGVEGCLTLEDGEILAYDPSMNTIEILPWQGYRSSYICLIYNLFGRIVAGKFLEAKTHLRLNELEKHIGGVAGPDYIIPTYWQPHLDDKIERITQLQNEGGIDSTSFGFITDTHIRDNAQNSGMLVQEIMKKCDVPYFIHGGDFVVGGESISKSSIINDIRINKEMFGEHFSRVLMVEGNHDSAYGGELDGEPVAYAKNLTPEECYNYYFRHNTIPPQRVVGGNGSYFYQDDSVNKIRYILLNSSDLPHEEDENGHSLFKYNKMMRALMREEQVKWFADVALNVHDDSWSVVVCSHIEPYSTDMPVRNGDIVARILQAFKDKTIYSGSSPSNVPEEFKFDISVDFTNKGGNVICWVSGHMHYDAIDRNTPENIDFNIVETLNDSLARWSDAPTKTRGTVTEQAFDVFTINKKTRTVDVTRVGAGQNRQISY